MRLFAYGSLCDAATATAALGRPVQPSPAVACGWERGWFVAIDNRASASYACDRCEGLPDACRVVGIRPAPGASVLGALIDLLEDDLPRIRARERSYALECIGVRDARDPRAPEVTALAAVPLPARMVPDAARVPVATAYEQAVMSALAALAAPLGVDADGQVLHSPAPRRDDLRYVRGDGVERRRCTCSTW